MQKMLSWEILDGFARPAGGEKKTKVGGVCYSFAGLIIIVFAVVMFVNFQGLPPTCTTEMKWSAYEQHGLNMEVTCGNKQGCHVVNIFQHTGLARPNAKCILKAIPAAKECLFLAPGATATLRVCHGATYLEGIGVLQPANLSAADLIEGWASEAPFALTINSPMMMEVGSLMTVHDPYDPGQYSMKAVKTVNKYLPTTNHLYSRTEWFGQRIGDGKRPRENSILLCSALTHNASLYGMLFVYLLLKTLCSYRLRCF